MAEQTGGPRSTGTALGGPGSTPHDEPAHLLAFFVFLLQKLKIKRATCIVTVYTVSLGSQHDLGWNWIQPPLKGTRL